VSDAQKYLIVNADDFGLSEGVNAGIIRAHEQGVLTSASLMVRGTAARSAADYAKKKSKLSVGLHVDLAEWIFRDGEWQPLYQVVSTDDAAAVRNELVRQLDTFCKLVGRNPTHIDSHQHVHRKEPARSVFIEATQTLSVPLRSFSPDVRHCGDFYGQTGEGEPYPEGISAKAFLTMLENLEPGFTEAGCHPGEDENLDSVYRLERKEEVKVLCDPKIRAAVERMQIQLCSFADIGKWKARRA
jgi:predicted glycoside hydrolase/deacetylase ChbG (UPF0249 family)